MISNPKARGEKSEAHILLACVEKGYAPSIPFGNNQRYDLIIDAAHKLLRVQCKTAWIAGGCVVFSCASKNGFTGKRKHYRDQVDLFLAYAPETGKIYRVPVKEAPGNEIRLRISPPKSRAPKSTIRWARDCEF